VTDARAIQKGLALMLPAFLFGSFVAAQWSTIALPGSLDVSIRYIDPLSTTVDRLQDEQTSLRAQLTDLRRQLDDIQRTGSAQSGAVREVQARIDELRTSAGLTEVRGEGVVVSIDTVKAPGTKEPERVCLAPDLTDVVNTAWMGGAQAVAINSERIVASSSVYCVGSTIVVNGSIVAAPFAVSAVGPASGLLAAMDDPAQLRDLKRRRDQFAVDMKVARATQLVLAPYTGPLPGRQAVPR
jgi:uncharacterized protein YlxW (UPF0749 family)